MEKEQVEREKLEQEIINFCNEYNKNAENILKNYIDNNNLNEIYKYPSLKRFIDENKKHYNIEYYISSFKIIHCECFDYNKDIILAYEYNFINNIDNINEIIKDQKRYLDRLNEFDKITLFDFTKQNSFKFYKLFKMNDKKWIDYRNNQINEFLPQIYKLGYYDSDDTIESIFNTKNSVLKYVLTVNEWIDVLNMFSNDVDRIINNSPELKHNIYCYRGSSTNYINNDTIEEFEMDNEIIQYKFNEQTSFTLDFNIAYSLFYGHQKSSCIYRTTIKKGSRALFISPLAAIKDELEVIIPSNSYAIKNNKPIERCYNNISNKYSICCGKLEFNSLDIVIFNKQVIIHDKSPILPTTIEINDNKFSFVTANINNLTFINDTNKINKLINKLINKIIN